MQEQISQQDRTYRDAQYAKMLTNTMYDLQDVRKRMNARLGALRRAGEVVSIQRAEHFDELVAEHAAAMEQIAETELAVAVAKIPVIKWLEKVKGIGPRLSGSLVGMLAPIDRFPLVSSFWRYCGQDVIAVCTNEKCNRIYLTGKTREAFLDNQVERRWKIHLLGGGADSGKRPARWKTDPEYKAKFMSDNYKDSAAKLCKCERPTVARKAPQLRYFKGLLLTFNPFMKMTCWKIAGQMVRQGKFYRDVYDERKTYYLERDCACENGQYPTLRKGMVEYYYLKNGEGLIAKSHVDNRARRAMAKLFLSHLWEMWRKSEGLPVGKFYLEEKLGDKFNELHTRIDPPYADLFE